MDLSARRVRRCYALWRALAAELNNLCYRVLARGLTPALRRWGCPTLVDLAKVGAPHSKLINPVNPAENVEKAVDDVDRICFGAKIKIKKLAVYCLPKFGVT